MTSFTEMLSLGYWFVDPGISQTLFLKAILVAFAGLFIAGVILKLWFKKGDFHPVKRKFLKPIPGSLMRWGLTGVLLALFRYEGAHYLSWRFWWLIFAVWVVFIIIRRVRFVREEYPRRMQMYEQRNDGREWEVKAKEKKSKKKKRK